MAGEQRRDSPFYPGHPVPAELFTGREKEIAYLMQRGAGQTSNGKPTSFFVQGEYGIGKSSVALYVQKAAELEHKMIGLYAPLGGVKTLEGLAAHILEATLRSGLYDRTWREQVQNWLGKYIGKRTLFGVDINFEALKLDAPKLASPTQILSFLEEIQKRNAAVRGGKGVLLVLDEINGIASEPVFAHFLKSLVDLNAFSAPRLPLMLMLCGVEDRRRELIRSHPPTDRLFDVVDIHPMKKAEMEEFFHKAFESVGVTVSLPALNWMTHAAAGYPKLMHLVGDRVFWRLSGEQRNVGVETAIDGVEDAVETVGRTLVDAAVYEALQSRDYKSILGKIGGLMVPGEDTFTRKDLAAKLTDTESKKLGNFLQRMKALNVIKPGEVRGTYQFRVRMVQMYIWLRSLRRA
jgi:hypothetical protein